MFNRILAVTSLAVLVANVGCSGAADSSESTASDQALVKTTATLSLADAQAKVNAIRAKFDPKNDNALILDDGLAPAYVAAIAPIFAEVAVTDKFALAETAVTGVSNAIVQEAVVTHGLFDDAVGSFADLWSFSFYYGGIQADPQFYPKLNLVISHSTSSPLSDLQILSLAGNVNATDFAGSLKALHWDTARSATAADAATIPDDSAPFVALNTALFGEVGYTAADDANAHDLDTNDAFAVEMFTKSYAKLRLFTQAGNDQGGDIVDLAGHLNGVEVGSGHKATKAIALAKTVLTSSQMKTLDIGLIKN